MATEKKKRDLKELKIKTEQQIKYLYNKATLSQEEIYTITKDFFSKLLEIDYQFSHEELLDELNRTYIEADTKQNIETFVRAIGKIEYNSSIMFEEDELKTFLSQLQEIADKLISEEAKQNTKGFSLFAKPSSKTLGDLIEEVKMENRFEKAKQKYEEALKKYNELTTNDQEMYYERLQEAYTHLKNAF